MSSEIIFKFCFEKSGQPEQRVLSTRNNKSQPNPKRNKSASTRRDCGLSWAWLKSGYLVQDSIPWFFNNLYKLQQINQNLEKLRKSIFQLSPYGFKWSIQYIFEGLLHTGLSKCHFPYMYGSWLHEIWRNLDQNARDLFIKMNSKIRHGKIKYSTDILVTTKFYVLSWMHHVLVNIRSQYKRR